MSAWATVDLGLLTEIRTGRLDANASSDNGEYPFFTCSKEPLRINQYSFDGDYVLVAGNAVFKSVDPKQTIHQLKSL